MNSHTKSKFILVIFLLLGSGLFAQERPPLSNDGFNIPFSNIEITGPENNSEVAFSLQLLLILTVLSLAPSIFVLMTGFLRIAIVFDFIKRSLSLQQVPPNQVLMGIALFLTLFIMWPTFTQIYDQGFVPMSNGEIGLEEFYGEVETPMREFMFAQMQNSNYEQIRLFMRLSGQPRPEQFGDVPTYVLIPAFVLHELTVAFMIGILLFIPFIIVDMVVASTLMSMGMIMLPPVMISLPFKLILFVLVDGWGLITTQVVNSFVI